VEHGLQLFEVALRVFLKVAVTKEGVDPGFEAYGAFGEFSCLLGG
jgi:hypothetical protein